MLVVAAPVKVTGTFGVNHIEKLDNVAVIGNKVVTELTNIEGVPVE